MVRTRAEKVARVADYIPEQEVLGAEDADLLVVGWGGTRGHLNTAVEQLQREGKSIALAHFNYINPLPRNAEQILRRYSKVVVCELNEGQLASYLRQTFEGLHIEQFNKTEGQPFTIVELKDKFTELLK